VNQSPQTFAPREAEAVLAHWRLKALFTRPAGGTANASLVVVGLRGQYVLRRRNPRYCDRGQLAYDHSVLHALAQAGLPVPHVVRAAGGSRWVEHEGRVYELHQYIEGADFTPDDLAEVAAAGAMLARLHRATEQLQPSGRKDWPRYFDPKVSTKSLKEARRKLRGPSPGDLSPYTPGEVDQTLGRLLQEAKDCERGLPDRAYWALPQAVIHGDWHPANLRFRDGQVIGVFDFDWVGRQPRMVDVTDGLLFFGSVREGRLDGGDIWSLTQPYTPDLERMRVFLQAYRAHVPLERAELAALPNLLRQRALYNRVDPMVRKVPEERQLAFLVAGRVSEPLDWISAHEPVLVGGL
jgi:Ser/Thr protein kinase RdoA (MazF antagonist)